MIEEGINRALLALARCLVEDTLELAVTFRTVREVPTLHAEVDGAQLALASARVEEVVQELVASGAGIVVALETVGPVAWLEELVAEDADNTFGSGEEVLAVGAELESVAGVVESLQGVQGGRCKCTISMPEYNSSRLIFPVLSASQMENAHCESR